MLVEPQPPGRNGYNSKPTSGTINSINQVVAKSMRAIYYTRLL